MNALGMVWGTRTASFVVLISATMVTICESVAAPPSKAPAAPLAADIAYTSISNNAAGRMWLSAAIRGITFDAAGQPCEVFQASDCTLEVPGAIGGMAAGAMDWK